MLMGIKEIEEILPHRHPFLLVDCIEELEPGVRAVGYKCVTFNEPQFQGHFPHNPVMPGVLIIEALAQAYISTQLSNTILFAVLIVVLLVKPSGLLGKYVPEKV